MVSSISEKSEYSENSENKHIKQRRKWEFTETKKYYEFLLKSRSILEQTEKKQKQRIYNKMAEYVGSRTTHQCRSHHQKVMKRYESIDNFIETFRTKLEAMSESEKQRKGLISVEENERKKSKIINKTKFKTKESPISIESFRQNIEEELKKLIEINRSSKEKQQIVEILRNLSEFTDKVTHNHSHQPEEKFDLSLLDAYKETQKINDNLFSFNSLENKSQFNKSRKDEPFFGQNQIEFPSHHKIHLNEFSTISNGQINPRKEWAEKIFENPNIYQKYLSDYYSNYSTENLSIGDYSPLPYILREMAENTLAEKSEFNTYYPNFCKESPEQMVNYAPYVCASVLLKENLNSINPFIKQNEVILTPEKIQIPLKKDENSSLWIECVKIEELEQDSMGNLSSEEIEKERIKEIVMELMRKEGITKFFENIQQKEIIDFSKKTEVIDANKKELSEPMNLYKDFKREEKQVCYPYALINDSFRQFPLEMSKEFLEKKESLFSDDYMRMKLEGKVMNEKLPKTAPSEEDAEKERLSQQLEKECKYNGFQKYSPYSAYNPDIIQSEDEKRKQFILACQYHQKNIENYPSMEEPIHSSLNYNNYTFPPSNIPNFPHLYAEPNTNGFVNFGYQHGYPSMYEQEIKQNFGINIPPQIFFHSETNQPNHHNFQETRNIK